MSNYSPYNEAAGGSISGVSDPAGLAGSSIRVIDGRVIRSLPVHFVTELVRQSMLRGKEQAQKLYDLILMLDPQNHFYKPTVKAVRDEEKNNRVTLDGISRTADRLLELSPELAYMVRHLNFETGGALFRRVKEMMGLEHNAAMA